MIPYSINVDMEATLATESGFYQVNIVVLVSKKCKWFTVMWLLYKFTPMLPKINYNSGFFYLSSTGFSGTTYNNSFSYITAFDNFKVLLSQVQQCMRNLSQPWLTRGSRKLSSRPLQWHRQAALKDFILFLTTFALRWYPSPLLEWCAG